MNGVGGVNLSTGTYYLNINRYVYKGREWIVPNFEESFKPILFCQIKYMY